MTSARSMLLGVLFACLSVGSALAKGERFNFKEQRRGGTHGERLTVERSWSLRDGTKVTERRFYGMTSKFLKGTQSPTVFNKPLEMVQRTTEELNRMTTVTRKFVGPDKARTTDKSWKTKRYSFDLYTRSDADGVFRMASVTDRVTGTTVRAEEARPGLVTIDGSIHGGAEGAKQIKQLTNKAKAILARP